MSARLRSLVDFLETPLRWWRRRRLSARVEVSLLIAGVLCLGGVVTAWRVARARPVQTGEGAGVDLSVDADTQAVFRQVRQLRTQDKDYATARSVAQTYLDAHRQQDWARQAVECEYAAIFYSERRWPEGLPLLEAAVSTYRPMALAARPALDAADEFCQVDDVQCTIGIIHHHSDQPQEAMKAYDDLVTQYPDSNRAAAERSRGGIARRCYSYGGSCTSSWTRWRRRSTAARRLR